MNKTNFLKSFQKGTGVFETCRLTQNSLKFVKKKHILCPVLTSYAFLFYFYQGIVT